MGNHDGRRRERLYFERIERRRLRKLRRLKREAKAAVIAEARKAVYA